MCLDFEAYFNLHSCREDYYSLRGRTDYYAERLRTQWAAEEYARQEYWDAEAERAEKALLARMERESIFRAEQRAQKINAEKKKQAKARDVLDRLWAKRSKAMDQILDERDRQWKAKAPSQHMVDRAIAAIARAIDCDPWNEIVQCALHQHIVMGMTVAEAAVYARNNLAMWQEPVPMSDEERQARNILRLP